jgi:hypothetical protein
MIHGVAYAVALSVSLHFFDCRFARVPACNLRGLRTPLPSIGFVITPASMMTHTEKENDRTRQKE